MDTEINGAFGSQRRKTLIEGRDLHSDAQKVKHSTSTTTTHCKRWSWLQQSRAEETSRSRRFVVWTSKRLRLVLNVLLFLQRNMKHPNKKSYFSLLNTDVKEYLGGEFKPRPKGDGNRVLRVLQHPLVARGDACCTACNRFYGGRGLVSRLCLVWSCSLTLSASNSR